MTEDEFAHAVRLLCQQCGGSVTSWGRTDTHSQAVGGFPGDPHSHWFGADVVWENQTHCTRVIGEGTDYHAIASQYGLHLVHETTHDHLQPFDYPAGPLTVEQVQAWKERASK